MSLGSLIMKDKITRLYEMHKMIEMFNMYAPKLFKTHPT